MGRSQSFVGLLAVGVVAIPVMTTLACGPGWVEPPLEGSLDGGNGGGSSGKPGSNEEVPCGTVTKLEAIPDPSSLPACCQAEKGEAHCLAEDKATPGIKKSMGKCESGGYCVPDSILKSGGAKPKSCTSAFGPGGCRSVCIPEVAKNKGALAKNDCEGADEICVPCIRPGTNEETGACANPPPATSACKTDAGAGPGGEPPPTTTPQTPAKSCCEDRGKCMLTTGLPQDSLASLNSKDCDESTQKCVPNDVIDVKTGKTKAVTCTPNFFLGGGKGVCVSDCLEFDFFAGLLLSQETCKEHNLCAPCIRDGKPTGAPGCE